MPRAVVPVNIGPPLPPCRTQTVKDEDVRTCTFHHYRLDGRATVRIHTGRDTDSDLYQDRRHYNWDNRSDTATVRNDHGRFIDDKSWSHHHHGGRHHR